MGEYFLLENEEGSTEEEGMEEKPTSNLQPLTSGSIEPPEPPYPPESMYQGISTPVTRYLYTGREYNIETGMYYYRARVMNPGHGRFTGKDPWTWQPDDERVFGDFRVWFTNKDIHLIWGKYFPEFKSNLFYYTCNTPIVFIDPQGRDTFVYTKDWIAPKAERCYNMDHCGEVAEGACKSWGYETMKVNKTPSHHGYLNYYEECYHSQAYKCLSIRKGDEKCK